MNASHVGKIATELSIKAAQVQATAGLLEEGATVPFIARSRKEATGSLDEVAIAAIRDRLAQLKELDQRRESIVSSLQERNLLSDELKSKLEAAQTLAVLEDLYLPYRPKIARDKSLEPPARTVPVTVIIPTLNEAANLPRCLEHLRWADDVVVVDSYSKDATPQIAEQWGARVIPFKWNGQWPKKKNWALRHPDLKHSWVLIVDADECIVPELAAEIAESIKSDHNVGYYINRRFIFLDKWIKHCGYYPSWNLRLIKRGFGEYERLTDVGDTGSGDNEVHEHVVAKGPVAYLKHDMLHYAFPDIFTFVEKHNRYSNWEAAVQLRQLSSDGAVSTNADLSRRRKLKLLSRKMPFRPLLRFLYAYVFQLGFLDGYAGFIFCRLLMMYEFLSVAKYYEIKQKARPRK